MTLFENETVKKLAEERFNPSAKFLIIGWINNDGGILAANTDELTAHRNAKILRDIGFKGVKVMPNNKETLQYVSDRVASLMTYGY
jgi:hypothetical protein